MNSQAVNIFNIPTTDVCDKAHYSVLLAAHVGATQGAGLHLICTYSEYSVP